jgi:hypothetical protein
MNTSANVEAIKDRLGGESPSRARSVAMAGTAGMGVALLVYRVLRDPSH